MKNIKYSFILILLFGFSSVIFADNKVSGSTIISAIDNGISIHYENTTIMGDLNFVEIDNKILDSGKLFGLREYSCKVKVPIVFINCTFNGNVVA